MQDTPTTVLRVTWCELKLVGKELRRRRSQERLRCVERRLSHADRSRAISSVSFSLSSRVTWETIEWYVNEAIIMCLLESLLIVHQKEPTVAADKPNSFLFRTAHLRAYFDTLYLTFTSPFTSILFINDV